MLRASDEASSSRETSLPRNRDAWDNLANDPRFAGIGTHPDSTHPDSPERAVSPERALAAIDPWVRGFGVAGRDLLCLASGGGIHAPLYAIAGARVTVVDISPRQLAHDDTVAHQLGLPIRTVCQSIDRLEALDDASFDVVIGGLCDAGFVITDFQEPPRADASATEGTPESRARFAPPYLKIRAVRRS